MKIERINFQIFVSLPPPEYSFVTYLKFRCQMINSWLNENPAKESLLLNDEG
ncbi:hypothetical protein D1AOALGA4SA_11956 [Olavius algarvensis Delta 1 endosymbiont]|nr:hypothetical protein D1AOALGA4SA_11956 [Olavius algarvensis Delta 1 endosymbiont]